MILNENIQQAKKILSEVDKTIEDNDFIELKKLTSSQPGYLGFFTKLYYLSNESLENIKNLLTTINSNKELLKKLPKQVVEYDNLEKIQDDLDNLIEWKQYKKQLVLNLNSSFKQKAKNDEELKTFWSNLNNAEKKETLFLIKQISSYMDYENFKDDLVNNITGTQEEVIEDINNSDNAYLVYNKDDIIIAEIWDRETSCKLGSKSWCISKNTSNRWESYNSLDLRTKQYFIWNYRVPPFSKFNMLGVTLNQYNKATSVSLKNNTPHNFKEYIEKFNIPRDIFKPLNPKEDIEKMIKVFGFKDEIIKIISKYNIKKYIHKVPLEYKLAYGNLSKSEKNKINLGSLKEEIKKGEESILIKAITLLTDEYYEEGKDIDGFLDEYKSSVVIDVLKEADFVDRVRLANIIVKNEEEKSKFIFHFEEDKDEIYFYYADILINFYEEEEYYNDLLNIDSGFNRFFDDYRNYINIDEEELSYAFRFLHQEDVKNTFVKLLKEYSNNLDNEVYNDIFKKLINSLDSEDYGEFEDSFNSLIELYKPVHELIRDTKWDIEEKVSELYQKDKVIFSENVKGEWDESESAWRVTFEDLVYLLDKENIYEGGLSDIKNKSINSLNDIEFTVTMDEYPSDSGYLFSIDYDKIEKEFIESCKRLLNDEDKMSEKNIYNNKINNLTKSGFKLYNNFRTSYWHKYLVETNYFILYNDIDIEADQEIKCYKNKVVDDVTSLSEYEIKDFDNIKIKLNDSEYSKEPVDPNQLEFQFEHLKTFKGFKLM